MQTSTTSVYQKVEGALLDLLTRVSPDPQAIDAKLSQLEKEHGAEVYSEFLHLLCHLRFSPSKAKAHWRGILEHQLALSSKLDSRLDFRVALLDYFVSVNQHFKNPKVIEIKIFQKTQDAAIRDDLTGLHNYRYFGSELGREIRRASRSNAPLSLLLLDADHFKWYNDHNGHLAGDRALRELARIIESQARDADIVARYGGEEFAVLLPGVNKPKALEVGIRICGAVSDHDFPFGAGQPGGSFTVSGGVSTYRVDAADAVALIEMADRALYLAKGRGKNRVLAVNDEDREASRTTLKIPGTLLSLTSERLTFVTDNVSSRGFQFSSSVRFETGAIFLFRLMLPESRAIDGAARVVRVESAGTGYEVGASIFEIAADDSQTLATYIATRPEAAAAETPAAVAETP